MQATMQDRLARVFEPCLTLYWKGRFGKFPDGWYADRTQDQRLLRQFLTEARVRSVGFSPSFATEDYDAVLAAAGAWGYSLETVGGELFTEDNHEPSL